jgi:hypothetical protein
MDAQKKKGIAGLRNVQPAVEVAARPFEQAWLWIR